MNRHIAIALSVACLGAAPAFADDITMEPHPFVSTMTRAQVLDELQAFRQSGVNPWADDYNPLAHAAGTMTRAEATAEFLRARSTVAAFTGEDSGSSFLARMAAARARPAGTELARSE